jgi:hypothetical protein
MVVAVATGWIIGWAIGLVVVLLAAGLLIAIIGLARLIEREADNITRALDGSRSNTEPLFDVARTNLALDRITRGLRRVRTGGSE